MTLCSDGHEEVCYDGFRKKCPICELLAEIAELETNIKYLIQKEEKAK